MFPQMKLCKTRADGVSVCVCRWKIMRCLSSQIVTNGCSRQRIRGFLRLRDGGFGWYYRCRKTLPSVTKDICVWHSRKKVFCIIYWLTHKKHQPAFVRQIISSPGRPVSVIFIGFTSYFKVWLWRPYPLICFCI